MQGYNAYRRVQGATATQNGRDLEYRLLAQVTGALIKAQDGKSTLPERLSAILRNEKAWGVFLADLNHPDNGLTRGLKTAMASPALWVRTETRLVIDTDAPPDALIHITRQSMDRSGRKDSDD